MGAIGDTCRSEEQNRLVSRCMDVSRTPSVYIVSGTKHVGVRRYTSRLSLVSEIFVLAYACMEVHLYRADACMRNHGMDL